MHFENNVCDNVIEMLLGVNGKSNGNLKVRLDLQVIGIKTSPHPVLKSTKMELPTAYYFLSTAQKIKLCQFSKKCEVAEWLFIQHFPLN